jgi:hypothetical protein
MTFSSENQSNNDSAHDDMLGKLALSYKLITRDQYIESMEIQKKGSVSGMRVLLSEVLFSQGLLTSEQIGLLNRAIEIMAKQRLGKRFGSIAVSKGFIRREELHEALEIQKIDESGKKREIGRILIDLGYMTEETRKKILEIQDNIRISIPKIEEISSDDAPVKQVTVNYGNDLVLNVSQDSLTAVIVLPEERKNITAREVGDFLDARKVNYGRLTDDYVEACIQNRELGIRAFVAALGKKGQPSVSGPVTVHFKRRPLESVGLFTPMEVKEGALLAERKMISEGSPKITVYGVGTVEKKGNGTFFMNGQGARINEGQTRIEASMDGEPFQFMDGVIGVLENRVVNDGGKDPMKLSVEGLLEVKGIIPEKSDIRCVHLKAAEIEGATVWAEGDVHVEGRIKDSTVVSGGRVSAETIDNCSISSLGDVTAVYDILDSTIETCCSCRAGSSILSSRIKAGRSVTAQDAAPTDGGPCVLEIGASVVPSIVTGEGDRLKRLERIINDVVEQIHKKESMTAIINHVVNKICLKRNKRKNELELLEQTVARMEQKSNRQIATGRSRIEAIFMEVDSSDQIVGVLVTDRNSLEKQAESLKKNLHVQMKVYREIKENVDRRSAFAAGRLEEISQIVRIEIRNEIEKGTSVVTPHGLKIIEKTLTCVIIGDKETDDGNRVMEITHERP